MKFILKIFLGILAFACLVEGNFPLAMCAMALGSLLIDRKAGPVLGLYAVPCDLGAMTTNDDCNSRGGIAEAYWTTYDEVDWPVMAADMLQFNTTTLLILDYTMVAAATFAKLEFKVEESFYNFTYTSDTDAYDQVITMVFEGKSNAQSLAFRKALGCCKIILHIIDVSGLERVVGVEWNGTAFTKQLRSLRVGRHLDTSGQLSQSRARDEMDLTGQSIRAPLYSTVTASGIPV